MMGNSKKEVDIVVEGYAPLDEPSRMAIVPQLVIPGRPYTGEPLTPRSAGFAVERALAERELAAAKAADAADEAFEAQRSARRGERGGRLCQSGIKACRGHRGRGE